MEAADLLPVYRPSAPVMGRIAASGAVRALPETRSPLASIAGRGSRCGVESAQALDDLGIRASVSTQRTAAIGISAAAPRTSAPSGAGREILAMMKRHIEEQSPWRRDHLVEAAGERAIGHGTRGWVGRISARRSRKIFRAPGRAATPGERPLRRGFPCSRARPRRRFRNPREIRGAMQSSNSMVLSEPDLAMFLAIRIA